MGFQDVSLHGAADLLESHSLLLVNEELAELDRQMCNEVQDRDDVSIREAFGQTDEAVYYFWNYDPL